MNNKPNFIVFLFGFFFIFFILINVFGSEPSGVTSDISDTLLEGIIFLVIAGFIWLGIYALILYLWVNVIRKRLKNPRVME